MEWIMLLTVLSMEPSHGGVDSFSAPISIQVASRQDCENLGMNHANALLVAASPKNKAIYTCARNIQKDLNVSTAMLMTISSSKALYRGRSELRDTASAMFGSTESCMDAASAHRSAILSATQEKGGNNAYAIHFSCTDLSTTQPR